MYVDNQALQERIAQALTDCGEAVRHANLRQIRRLIEATYRSVMSELPEDLLDEDELMPKIVGYLDVMMLAGGTLGRRADQMLLDKIFQEDAPAVTTWLRKRGLVIQNEEGAQELTDDGQAFLEERRVEPAPLQRQSQGGRYGGGGRGRRRSDRGRNNTPSFTS